MQTIYRADLKAHVSVDERELVRHIRHSDEYWASEHTSPLATASAYLDAMADTLGIDKAELGSLDKRVSFLDPLDQGTEYQLSEEKPLFESTLIGYVQTHLNVPVWRRGLTVRVKLNPTRVVGMTNNSEGELRAKLPPAQTIERYRAIFRQTLARRAAVAAGLDEDEAGGVDEAVSFLRAAVKADPPGPSSRRTRAAKTGETRLLSGKFVVYRYVESRRYGGKRSPTTDQTVEETAEEAHDTPYPTLPAVPAAVKDGQAYLAAELIFTSDDPGFGGLAWLALVELRSGAVLYLECMTCGLNGQVFRRDPIVKTGDLTITADDAVATLNMQRDDEPLTNLDAAVAGTQSLSGTYVKIAALTPMHADPDTVPPTKPSSTDFNFDSRTNDFGAVSAYYHLTELFKTIADLGFPISTYFDGTTFPIPIDHRALGDAINAHWFPNGSDGTAHMCFALCDLTNTAQPLLRAVDPWVHWHEMGGHGTLGDHVGSGNLGFSHSAGDGLAAIQQDPESKLRELAKPERFRYAPFRPFVLAPVVGDPTPPERRFDRGVAAWAWGGPVVTDASGNVLSGDDGGYGSEQILATCHFRIYRSIGGDHAELARRRFASRMTTWLILETIRTLTSGTNPSNFNPVTMTTVPGRGAQLWCEALQATDGTNWTSEGVTGGAYNKVIRWAFEKQGSYQPAGAPTPVTTEGAPPTVDVYIDDGRGGEYPFQAVHWQNMSIWNRNAPDGGLGHQNANDGVTNYMYGKVKNRGTSAAANVTVRAYHSLPGAGLTWPTDFVEMNPVGGLPIASIPANNALEFMVGPFEWEPNLNVYGHDCVLMIASVASDTSNVDSFTASETIQEWRLVPNDNNIAQRNVTVLPGGGGMEALIAALDRAPFFAGNNLNVAAAMELRFELPPGARESGLGAPRRRHPRRQVPARGRREAAHPAQRQTGEAVQQGGDRRGDRSDADRQPARERDRARRDVIRHRSRAEGAVRRRAQARKGLRRRGAAAPRLPRARRRPKGEEDAREEGLRRHRARRRLRLRLTPRRECQAPTQPTGCGPVPGAGPQTPPPSQGRSPFVPRAARQPPSGSARASTSSPKAYIYIRQYY